MKIINLMFAFLFALTFVTAISIDAGECETIELETSNEISWIAFGNEHPLEGIELNQVGNQLEICLDVMFLEDSFTISLIEKETKEVIREVNVGGGGGGSRTVYKDRNVTTYVDREVTEYVHDEVPGDTVEVDKIVKINKIPLILWIVLVAGAGIIIFLSFKKTNTVDKEVQKNE